MSESRETNVFAKHMIAYAGAPQAGALLWAMLLYAAGSVVQNANAQSARAMRPRSSDACRHRDRMCVGTAARANDARLADLDDAINAAVARDEIPGAVLLVGQRDQILWRKAYGSRAILPSREPMTVDTIFDLASLTKIFATTASMMKLFEAGKIRLNDNAVRYIPELGTQGATADKNQITIRHLMTHTAGFAGDPDDKKIAAGLVGCGAAAG